MAVVVTGGASGIGASISQALIAAGADVSIWARGAERLNVFGDEMQARYDRQPLTMAVDVSDEDSVQRAMESVVSEWGRVDGLVNNAGINKVGPSMDFEVESFREILDVNVVGAFLCARSAAAEMVKGGGGSIVNIASIASLTGQPERAAYVASKAALAGMTKSFAVEWGVHGIRVNAVAPGYTRTDMVNSLIAKGVLEQDTITGRTPLRRMGNPDDIADSVLYLLGPASGFVTGHILQVDGGWMANGYYK